jgi:hypothetical protein
MDFSLYVNAHIHHNGALGVFSLQARLVSCKHMMPTNGQGKNCAIVKEEAAEGNSNSKIVDECVGAKVVFSLLLSLMLLGSFSCTLTSSCRSCRSESEVFLYYPETYRMMNRAEEIFCR